MKLKDGSICLEYTEYVEVFGVEIYKSDKKRGLIKLHSRGGQGSIVLIDYESLPKKRKEEVVKRYGDPKKYIIIQPIKDLIRWDLIAEQYYRDYVLPNGNKLPDDHVTRYTQAVSYLNTIQHLITDKRALKESLNVSIATFWERIFDLIRAENVRLPLSEKRMKERLKLYKESGYGSLIESHRFGNSNSKKVDDKEAEALLLEMIAHDHQFDYSVIAKQYNIWAEQAGKATITRAAVCHWAKKNTHLITQNRVGIAANYSKNVKYINRARPSAPLVLVGSDDNVLDLYFRREKKTAAGKIQTNDYFRPVLYLVVDAFNDHILGYAVGETVTIDLIQAAYLNAVHYIKQITGETYLPHQIQMDHWGLDPQMKGTLGQFYKSIAHATPATAKAAQGKYIERTFGTVWHQLLKMFPNYAGYNIQAKERISPEAIERNRKDFPSVKDAPAYIESFINHLRKDTLNEYLTAFNASTVSKERQISDEKRLATFGYLHTDKSGKPISNRLSPAGLRPTIGGIERLYDIPEQLFPYHANKKVQVIYDPYDLDKVLVTDGNGLRFVAGTYELMPSAIRDMKPGDMARLNNLMEGKKRMAAVPGQKQTERRLLLEEAGISAQSVLQAGVLTKEIRHSAERFIQQKAQDMHLLPEPEKESIYNRY